MTDGTPIQEQEEPSAAQAEDEEVVVDQDNNQENTQEGSQSSTQAPEIDAGGGKRVAVFNNEIEISIGRRLPQFDKGPIKAYEARAFAKGGKGGLFALICEPHLVPQSKGAPSYMSILASGMAKLISCGPVLWPPEQRYRYCFIYENSLGQPIMSAKGDQILAWRQDHVMKAVVKPMINTLLDLRNADVIHGDIRPTNMFDGGSRDVEKIILGDCLSGPPGYTQPVLYETIERAMCDPISKGRGTYEDDLYSFGVSLTVLMRKKNHLAGMSDDEIIREKVEHGSYVVLTGSERYSGSMLELLRGLLYDDPDQRWTLEDVLQWLEGQHVSSRQSNRKKKASRPVIMKEQEYYRQSLLAMDMNRPENVQEAAQLIENGELEQWISRSLEDNLVKGRLEKALQEAHEMGRGPGYFDRLVSRVGTALDPEGPMRFRDVRAHPDGFTYALTEAVVLKKDVSPFVDLIDSNLAMFWVSSQSNVKVDVGSIVSRFDSCRAFLRQKNLGYGIERCVYFLNSEVPCLSERVKDRYVRSPEEMMYALELLSQSPDRPELFLDRHIAAFLSVKDRKVIDVYWNELNAPEFYKRILGNIKTLATIQKRAKMDAFPGIANWISEILEPVYERYHDRELREVMRKKVEGIKAQGDLMKIAALFDNNEVLQQDFTNFKLAMRDYDNLRKEKAKMESKLEKPDVFGREAAKEVSAIVSGLLGGVFILVLSFLFFLQRGIF